MAKAADRKCRVNMKQLLEKWDKRLKDGPKSKHDILLKTCSNLRDLEKQDLAVEDCLRKGKTILHQLKEGKEGSFPPEFLEDLEKTFIVHENFEKKNEDSAKGAGARPRTPEKGQLGNQDVGFGPAPKPSPNSPMQMHKTMVDVKKASGYPDTEHLHNEIKKLQKSLDEKQKKLEEVKHICNDREVQLEDLESKIQTKDLKIESLKEEAENLAKRFEKENIDLTQARKELDSKQKMNQTLEERVNECVSQELAYKKQFEEMTTYIKKLEKDKEKSRQRDMEHYQEELKQQARKHDDQYKKLMAERDDLRDRFSKLAGAKLQEKNADIADLSDPNRAMKLSEKFGQIYDDEWTNAFEVLTDKKAGLQLKDAINFLLRLLQECWSYCNTLMDKQMESVHSMFLLPAQNVAKFDQKKMGKKNPPRISSKDNQTLYDLRRKIGVFPAVVEEVKEALLAESKRWDKQKIGYDTKYVDACAPYIQKCAEICWLMALHDPPLYMKMEVKPGEKLDQNIYSVYSSSGNSIDFLVWPPLYNGKDGGLLAKGVVEPQKTIGKKK